MHFVKLLRQLLMAQGFAHQGTDLQVCITVLIGYTTLGIHVTEADRSFRGKRNASHRHLCATK